MAARRLLHALLVGTLLVLVAPPAHAASEATSSASAEQTLVELINDRRAEAGAPALTARADLHDVARDWSFSQAERGEMGHNPHRNDQVCCWTKIAENVARSSGHGGSSAAAVADALMELWRNSPGHDQTMVDPEVDQVGLGVVVDDDGTAWGTAVFRRCDGSSACAGGAQGPSGDQSVSWAPPPPPPSPAPTTAPAPEPEPEPEPQAPSPAAATAPRPQPSPVAAPTPSPSPSSPWEPSPPPLPTEVPTTGGPDASGPSSVATAPMSEVLATATAGEPRRAGLRTGTLVLVAAAIALASAVATRRRP